MMKTLLIALTIAFSLASCKTVKYENYLNASKTIDHKLEGYTLLVSEFSFVQALSIINDDVRVPDVLNNDLKSLKVTIETGNLANLCSRYVQDDLEKNVVSEKSGLESGRIIIQVVESKMTQSLDLLELLSVMFMHSPTLLGIPIRKSKLEQTLRMRIFDKDGKKIVDLKGSGSSEAFVACYYGYHLSKVNDKICLDTLYQAMEEIKAQLKKSPNYESL